jgi:succinate dehydrogenase / fumarate reductase cytochrome b subunit
MVRLVRLLRTSIGRKLLVAVTGLAMGLFVIGHLLGNLLLFKGPEAFNGYADYLKGHPLLWVSRIGLLVVLIVHVVTAMRLYRENRAARPQRYVVDATVEASFASRHMVFSGLLVLAFVVYHLLHLTVGVIEPDVFREMHAKSRPDVYGMVVHSFSSLWIAISYVVAMLLLGMHLIHGFLSFLRTVGVHHESYNALIRIVGPVLVIVIITGFCSIPLGVYLGVIQARPDLAAIQMTQVLLPGAQP